MRQPWTCPHCGLKTRGYGAYSHQRRCHPELENDAPPGDVDDCKTSHELFERIEDAYEIMHHPSTLAFLVEHPDLYIYTRQGLRVRVIGERGNKWLTTVGPYSKRKALMNDLAHEAHKKLVAQAMASKAPRENRFSA